MLILSSSPGQHLVHDRSQRWHHVRERPRPQAPLHAPETPGSEPRQQRRRPPRRPPSLDHLQTHEPEQVPDPQHGALVPGREAKGARAMGYAATAAK